MTKTIKLCQVRQGECFIFDDVELVKLDEDNGATFAVTADTLPDYCQFEDDDATREDHNNFIGSLIQKKVEQWLREEHPAIAEAVVERSIDLTSMDGMTDYGTPMTFARILTVDEYRKYRRFIPLTNKPYWLATPWCTLRSPSSYSYRAYFVNTSGALRIFGVYFATSCCPRPALALSSEILVSVETEEKQRSIRDYSDTELIDELYRRRLKGEIQS